jgi:BTB/POZ domain-containing adapter for CUL3-mediated RhoA degradation protein
VEELLAEAKYYLVQGLADECHAALQVLCITLTYCKHLPVINLSLGVSPSLCACVAHHAIELFVSCFPPCVQNKDMYEPFCKVPLVTSSKEEQRLISTSNKVKRKITIYMYD